MVTSNGSRGGGNGGGGSGGSGGGSGGSNRGGGSSGGRRRRRREARAAGQGPRPSLPGGGEARPINASGVQVGPGTLVGVGYALHDAEGELVEATPPDEPMIYVHGYGQLMPALEAVLEGMVEGQRRSAWLDPHDAFGPHDPSAVFEVERDEFPQPERVKIGDEFAAEGEKGSFSLRVIDILPDGFVVDANHPLAGQRLRVTAQVEHVRAASAEELEEAERALEAAQAAGEGPALPFGQGGEPATEPPSGAPGVRPGGLLSADSLLRRRGGGRGEA